MTRSMQATGRAWRMRAGCFATRKEPYTAPRPSSALMGSSTRDSSDCSAAATTTSRRLLPARSAAAAPSPAAAAAPGAPLLDGSPAACVFRV